MGKKPKRTSPKEVNVTSQAAATETVPYGFRSPESSTIEGANYDPDTEVLHITFAHDHSTYAYDKFPYLMWVDFLGATSKGKFFSTRIRPIFSGTKL